MKRKVLLAVTLCSAIIMAGCGNTTPGAQDAPSIEVSVENAETPKAAESQTAAEDNIAAAPEEGTFDDSGYGEKLIPDADGRISNGFMSIAMPKELAGTYAAYSYDSDINIYDKESMESGYGGFAFGVCATEDYGAFGGMRTKIGELTAADGTLYHVLLYYPSEVQWDYTKSEEAPPAFDALYNYAAEVSKTIKAENGGTYADGAGIRGEDIYGDLAKDIVKKIRNAKSSQDLQNADLSALYYDMTQGDTPLDPMEFIGIAYEDINLDGIDEMVIAETETNRVYDIFTSVNGKPAHVVSGYKSDYYKINGSLIYEYITGDMDVDNINCFDLMPNETELVYQYGLEINNSENAENKWSINYSDEPYTPITEEEFNERMTIIQDVLPENDITFTPLGKIQ